MSKYSLDITSKKNPLYPLFALGWFALDRAEDSAAQKDLVSRLPFFLWHNCILRQFRQASI